MRNLRSQEKIIASWHGDPDKPVVSICCITYNHEPFIEDALEGFLTQKTDFPFEIIIHDDASTDLTPNIIREYEAKYPKLIRPIYQTENKFSKGIRIISLLIPLTKGNLIAICEGDDYWTDPYKLKIQTDFLNKNTDFSICFHDAIINMLPNMPDHLGYKQLLTKTTFDIDDFVNDNIIINCTVMYKWMLPKTLPDWFNKLKIGDWPLHLLQLQYGKAKYIERTMARYKIHENGYWSKNVARDPSFKLETKKNIYTTLPKSIFQQHNPQHLIESSIVRLTPEILDFYYLRNKYISTANFLTNNIKYLSHKKIIFILYLAIARLFYIKLPSTYTFARKLFHIITSDIDHQKKTI